MTLEERLDKLIYKKEKLESKKYEISLKLRDIQGEIDRVNRVNRRFNKQEKAKKIWGSK